MITISCRLATTYPALWPSGTGRLCPAPRFPHPCDRYWIHLRPWCFVCTSARYPQSSGHETSHHLRSRILMLAHCARLQPSTPHPEVQCCYLMARLSTQHTCIHAGATLNFGERGAAIDVCTSLPSGLIPSWIWGKPGRNCCSQH